jgi:DNA-binding response OmpR family regulator
VFHTSVFGCVCKVLSLGSRFYFSIPWVKPLADQGAKSETIMQNQQVSDSKNIIIIEDDGQCRQIMTESLEKSGFHVNAYEIGKDAVKEISRLKPDAVVLDINLPDANGFEILRRLKEDQATTRIPVIVCTIVPESKLSLSLGAVDHLSKPIKTDRLVEAVKRATANDPKMKIVAIDDDPAILESYKLVLKNTCETICFESGEKGLEYLRNSKSTGLVIVDLIMPGMDGFEVINQIRKDISKDVPVIVITDKDLTREEREKIKDSIQDICKKSQLAWRYF